MLEGMVTGTSKSHQRISPPDLLLQTVLVSGNKLIGAFEPTIGPFLAQQLANRVLIRTLAATRDLLLPKLMSREIRVKDAEKIVEAAQ
jgi:type I restriction enzyme S subunit